jgi:hypothetical protein
VHSTSDVRYTVPTGCTRFDAVVGVDDEVVVDGSVAFTVAQGTTTLFRSGVRRFDSPNLSISVPVVAGRELRLLVSDGGNGTSNDHADWADARFTCTAPVVSPSPAPTPTTAPSSARHVSDLVPVSQTNGWGPVEKDRSNGEQGAGDGRTLVLDGTSFAKGLGVHSTSDVRYTVPTGCTRFDAVVGVDDEVVVDGSVTFSVQQGTTVLHDSGVRRFDSPNQSVSVPVVAGRELRLLVSDGGNGTSNDHADWADARFTCAAPVAGTSPAPTPTTSPTTAPSPAPSVTPTTAPTPTASTPAVPSGRDFGAAAALWNPIPAGARVDVNSAAVRAKVAEAGASRVALLYEFGNKIYHADASTPRYKLNIVNAGVTKWGDNDLAYGTVPIPDGAVPGTGSDGKLVIVDHSTRKVYDLWQVFRSGSTWNVSWGGVYDLDGDGSSRNPAYGTGQWGVAWPKPLSRGTGSGMSTLAGTVKMSEIKAGVIPHALVFATDITCGPGQTGEFRWPATTTDGSRTSGTCIPEGARIQLDPSIDLTTIPGITKAELALGRALQTYGAYATDGGGSRISIGFEAPKAGDDNPYPAAGLAWDYWSLDRLPWHSVRMLTSWNGA